VDVSSRRAVDGDGRGKLAVASVECVSGAGTAETHPETSDSLLRSLDDQVFSLNREIEELEKRAAGDAQAEADLPGLQARRSGLESNIEDARLKLLEAYKAESKRLDNELQTRSQLVEQDSGLEESARRKALDELARDIDQRKQALLDRCQVLFVSDDQVVERKAIIGGLREEAAQAKARVAELEAKLAELNNSPLDQKTGEIEKLTQERDKARQELSVIQSSLNELRESPTQSLPSTTPDIEHLSRQNRELRQQLASLQSSETQGPRSYTLAYSDYPDGDVDFITLREKFTLWFTQYCSFLKPALTKVLGELDRSLSFFNSGVAKRPPGSVVAFHDFSADVILLEEVKQNFSRLDRRVYEVLTHGKNCLRLQAGSEGDFAFFLRDLIRAMDEMLDYYADQENRVAQEVGEMLDVAGKHLGEVRSQVLQAAQLTAGCFALQLNECKLVESKASLPSPALAFDDDGEMVASESAQTKSSDLFSRIQALCEKIADLGAHIVKSEAAILPEEKNSKKNLQTLSASLRGLRGVRPEKWQEWREYNAVLSSLKVSIDESEGAIRKTVELLNAQMGRELASMGAVNLDDHSVSITMYNLDVRSATPIIEEPAAVFFNCFPASLPNTCSVVVQRAYQTILGRIQENIRLRDSRVLNLKMFLNDPRNNRVFMYVKARQKLTLDAENALEAFKQSVCQSYESKRMAIVELKRQQSELKARLADLLLEFREKHNEAYWRAIKKYFNTDLKKQVLDLFDQIVRKLKAADDFNIQLDDNVPQGLLDKLCEAAYEITHFEALNLERMASLIANKPGESQKPASFALVFASGLRKTNDLEESMRAMIKRFEDVQGFDRFLTERAVPVSALLGEHQKVREREDQSISRSAPEVREYLVFDLLVYWLEQALPVSYQTHEHAIFFLSWALSELAKPSQSENESTFESQPSNLLLAFRDFESQFGSSLLPELCGITAALSDRLYPRLANLFGDDYYLPEPGLFSTAVYTRKPRVSVQVEAPDPMALARLKRAERECKEATARHEKQYDSLQEINSAAGFVRFLIENNIAYRADLFPEAGPLNAGTAERGPVVNNNSVAARTAAFGEKFNPLSARRPPPGAGQLPEASAVRQADVEHRPFNLYKVLFELIRARNFYRADPRLAFEGIRDHLLDWLANEVNLSGYIQSEARVEAKSGQIGVALIGLRDCLITFGMGEASAVEVASQIIRGEKDIRECLASVLPTVQDEPCFVLLEGLASGLSAVREQAQAKECEELERLAQERAAREAEAEAKRQQDLKVRLSESTAVLDSIKQSVSFFSQELGSNVGAYGNKKVEIEEILKELEQAILDYATQPAKSTSNMKIITQTVGSQTEADIALASIDSLIQRLAVSLTLRKRLLEKLDTVFSDEQTTDFFGRVGGYTSKLRVMVAQLQAIDSSLQEFNEVDVCSLSQRSHDLNVQVANLIDQLKPFTVMLWSSLKDERKPALELHCRELTEVIELAKNRARELSDFAAEQKARAEAEANKREREEAEKREREEAQRLAREEVKRDIERLIEENELKHIESELDTAHGNLKDARKAVHDASGLCEKAKGVLSNACDKALADLEAMKRQEYDLTNIEHALARLAQDVFLADVSRASTKLLDTKNDFEQKKAVVESKQRAAVDKANSAAKELQALKTSGEVLLEKARQCGFLERTVLAEYVQRSGVMIETGLVDYQAQINQSQLPEVPEVPEVPETAVDLGSLNLQCAEVLAGLKTKQQRLSDLANLQQTISELVNGRQIDEANKTLSAAFAPLAEAQSRLIKAKTNFEASEIAFKTQHVRVSGEIAAINPENITSSQQAEQSIKILTQADFLTSVNTMATELNQAGERLSQASRQVSGMQAACKDALSAQREVLKDLRARGAQLLESAKASNIDASALAKLQAELEAALNDGGLLANFQAQLGDDAQELGFTAVNPENLRRERDAKLALVKAKQVQLAELEAAQEREQKSEALERKERVTRLRYEVEATIRENDIAVLRQPIDELLRKLDDLRDQHRHQVTAEVIACREFQTACASALDRIARVKSAGDDNLNTIPEKLRQLNAQTIMADAQIKLDALNKARGCVKRLAFEANALCDTALKQLAELREKLRILNNPTLPDLLKRLTGFEQEINPQSILELQAIIQAALADNGILATLQESFADQVAAIDYPKAELGEVEGELKAVRAALETKFGELGGALRAKVEQGISALNGLISTYAREKKALEADLAEYSGQRSRFAQDELIVLRASIAQVVQQVPPLTPAKDVRGLTQQLRSVQSSLAKFAEVEKLRDRLLAQLQDVQPQYQPLCDRCDTLMDLSQRCRAEFELTLKTAQQDTDLRGAVEALRDQLPDRASVLQKPQALDDLLTDYRKTLEGAFLAEKTRLGQSLQDIPRRIRELEAEAQKREQSLKQLTGANDNCVRAHQSSLSLLVKVRNGSDRLVAQYKDFLSSLANQSTPKPFNETIQSLERKSARELQASVRALAEYQADLDRLSKSINDSNVQHQLLISAEQGLKTLKQAFERERDALKTAIEVFRQQLESSKSSLKVPDIQAQGQVLADLERQLAELRAEYETMIQELGALSQKAQENQQALLDAISAQRRQAQLLSEATESRRRVLIDDYKRLHGAFLDDCRGYRSPAVISVEVEIPAVEFARINEASNLGEIRQEIDRLSDLKSLCEEQLRRLNELKRDLGRDVAVCRDNLAQKEASLAKELGRLRKTATELSALGLKDSGLDAAAQLSDTAVSNARASLEAADKAAVSDIAQQETTLNANCKKLGAAILQLRGAIEAAERRERIARQRALLIPSARAENARFNEICANSSAIRMPFLGEELQELGCAFGFSRVAAFSANQTSAVTPGLRGVAATLKPKDIQKYMSLTQAIGHTGFSALETLLKDINGLKKTNKERAVYLRQFIRQVFSQCLEVRLAADQISRRHHLSIAAVRSSLPQLKQLYTPLPREPEDLLVRAIELANAIESRVGALWQTYVTSACRIKGYINDDVATAAAVRLSEDGAGSVSVVPVDNSATSLGRIEIVTVMFQRLTVIFDTKIQDRDLDLSALASHYEALKSVLLLNLRDRDAVDETFFSEIFFGYVQLLNTFIQTFLEKGNEKATSFATDHQLKRDSWGVALVNEVLKLFEVTGKELARIARSFSLNTSNSVLLDLPGTLSDSKVAVYSANIERRRAALLDQSDQSSAALFLEFVQDFQNQSSSSLAALPAATRFCSASFASQATAVSAADVGRRAIRETDRDGRYTGFTDSPDGPPPPPTQTTPVNSGANFQPHLAPGRLTPAPQVPEAARRIDFNVAVNSGSEELPLRHRAPPSPPAIPSEGAARLASLRAAVDEENAASPLPPAVSPQAETGHSAPASQSLLSGNPYLENNREATARALAARKAREREVALRAATLRERVPAPAAAPPPSDPSTRSLGK